jgi:hypothetical protein
MSRLHHSCQGAEVWLLVTRGRSWESAWVQTLKSRRKRKRRRRRRRRRR